jgi:leader peptidase (prepilin peptidase)/N-methyltransferase
VEFSIFIFILGAMVGSFLNMLIYRLPLEISLINPKRSICPNCDSQIKWSENIPIFSYLFLKGKCSNCKQPISSSYLFVEVLSGGVFVALFLKFGLNITFVLYSILFSLLILLSFIDFKYKAVPDYLLLFSLLVAFFIPNFSFTDALIFAGGFVLLDFFVTFYIQNIKAKITKNEELRTQKALGEGDIPIVAIIGGVLGLKLGLFAIIFASVFAIIPALYGHFKHQEIETPFIPYLSLGLFLVLLLGESIYTININ